MSAKNSPDKEREVILHRSEKRPYGVKVRFQVQTASSIGNIQEVVYDLPTGAILKISPGRQAPREGGKNFVATLEGFATAAAAEAAGRQLVQALLWMAVSINFPLRLDYRSYEPASVFERNRSMGVTFECYGESLNPQEKVLKELSDGYSKLLPPDQSLLLSMEIYCASRLEASPRARFLSLVSALEPLAKAASLGPGASDFIDNCLDLLDSDKDIPPSIISSLKGRLLELKKESVRRAIKRMLGEIGLNSESILKIDEAYSLRSQIVHNGIPNDLDTDLEEEYQSVSKVIRDIYSHMLQRDLLHSNVG